MSESFGRDFDSFLSMLESFGRDFDSFLSMLESFGRDFDSFLSMLELFGRDFDLFLSMSKQKHRFNLFRIVIMPIAEILFKFWCIIKHRIHIFNF